MAETYDITYSGEHIGTARMERQGLYCSFSCRCRQPDSGMYRIHVLCDERREDLGICIPMGDAFGMDKRIPAKRLGEGKLTFELVTKDWKPQETIAVQVPEPVAAEEENIPATEQIEENFVPVSEEEPFEYLDKLENAVMEVRDDQPGILIHEAEG